MLKILADCRLVSQISRHRLGGCPAHVAHGLPMARRPDIGPAVIFGTVYYLFGKWCACFVGMSAAENSIEMKKIQLQNPVQNPIMSAAENSK